MLGDPKTIIKGLVEMNSSEDPEFGPLDLSDYARQKAVEVLLTNWSVALRNGANLSDLLSDIDRTMQSLGDFKSGIEERFEVAGPGGPAI